MGKYIFVTYIHTHTQVYNFGRTPIFKKSQIVSPCETKIEEGGNETLAIKGAVPSRWSAGSSPE